MASGPKPTSGQYFDPSPKSNSDRKTIRLHLVDLSLELTTDRGVFSPDSVDSGTKSLLMTEFEARPAASQILDLGTGYGPIALAVAKRNPNATVTAVDVNQRARELCATNAANNSLTNVEVADPEEVSTEIQFDEIWSNPPIRVGKAVLHQMLERWIGQLKPSGVARLVVHKHLGGDTLSNWMKSREWSVERVSSKQGYRILEVRTNG